MAGYAHVHRAPGRLLCTGIAWNADSPALAADVVSAELNWNHTAYTTEIAARFALTGAELLHGRSWGGVLWDELLSWQQADPGNKPPPEMKALLELAKRHPEEYAELREGEAVIQALGG